MSRSWALRHLAADSSGYAHLIHLNFSKIIGVKTP